MGWPPDFWRGLGMNEWTAWRTAVRNLAQGGAAEGRTSPDSWRGADRDPAWQAMRARHRAAMGR